jgi:hypothetical protein
MEVEETAVTLSLSWLGLSRPSTSCFELRQKDVDARPKAGHDAECWARSRHKDKDHD